MKITPTMIQGIAIMILGASVIIHFIQYDRDKARILESLYDVNKAINSLHVERLRGSK